MIAKPFVALSEKSDGISQRCGTVNPNTLLSFYQNGNKVIAGLFEQILPRVFSIVVELPRTEQSCGIRPLLHFSLPLFFSLG